MAGSRVLPRNEGITRMFTRHNKLLSRLPLPGGRGRWIALVAPVAAATALSVVPLAASSAATPPVSATTRMSPAAPAAALPVMTFRMNGKTVSVGGALKSGAERIEFIVTGEASGGPGLIRLDNGVSLAQFFAVFAAAGQDPNNLYGVGQIVMSTQANKGTSSAYLGLTPGTYVALDLNAPTKTPPFTVFTVTKSSHPAALPKAGGTVATIEFGFRGATVLHQGEMVRWANDGFLVHMIFGAQAPNRATADKIAALLKAGKDNAAEALAIGSYQWDGALSHGQAFQTVITQPAGFWVIACFMDTQDGREHTLFGMEKVIQIVK